MAGSLFQRQVLVRVITNSNGTCRSTQDTECQRAICQFQSDCYFSDSERMRVTRILKPLKLIDHRDIVLIYARTDNKPSGSKA